MSVGSRNPPFPLHTRSWPVYPDYTVGFQRLKMPALEPISERTEDRDNVNDGRGPGATSGFVWDDASRLQSIGHGGKWDDLSEKRTATARRSPPRQLPSDSNMEFQFAPRPITATNRNRVPGPIVASAAQPSSGLGSAHGKLM